MPQHTNCVCGRAQGGAVMVPCNLDILQCCETSVKSVSVQAKLGVRMCKLLACLLLLVIRALRFSKLRHLLQLCITRDPAVGVDINPGRWLCRTCNIRRRARHSLLLRQLRLQRWIRYPHIHCNQRHGGQLSVQRRRGFPHRPTTRYAIQVPTPWTRVRMPCVSFWDVVNLSRSLTNHSKE